MFTGFQFFPHSIFDSSLTLSSHCHTLHPISTTATISNMPNNLNHNPSRSPADPGHVYDSSDKPMSPRDRAHCHSDKRWAVHSPSPCRCHSPCHEGHHEKHRHVTACNDSPPPAQWIATTTGLLFHDPRDQCPECLAYQHHVSLDLVLETSSIMNVHDDCLMNLTCILGRDDAAVTLHNELELVRHDHNNWHR